MAKEKKETPETSEAKLMLNQAAIGNGYTAIIEGENISIAAGQTEIPKLSNEQTRQLLIARVLIEA